MKKLFLVLALSCATFTGLQAQSYEIAGVSRSFSRGNGAIVKNNQVSGYYFFYLLDKLDKKTNSYRLIITDNNYKEVAKKDIEGPSNLVVIDAAYNEKELAVKFIDTKGKEGTQTIRLFDNEANEKKSVSFPFDVIASLTANNMKTVDELETADLHPIDNIGFLNLTTIQTKGGVAKRIGVSIDMITDAPGFKQWKYESPEKSIEIPEYLGNNGEIAFFSMMKKSSYMSKEVSYSISGYNIQSGSLAFDKEFKDDKYVMDVVSINPTSNKNETYFFGSLLQDDVKASKSKSLGMFIAKVDNKGNYLQKNTFLWKDVVKDFNPVDEKGNPIDIGNVYIHKVITNADGKVYAIGERFYKAASGAGIAMNALSALGGGSPAASVVKVVVAEFVILELGKDLKPVSIEFIEKGKNNVQLPAGAGMMGSSVLGPYAKAVGGFDYQFTQIFDGKEGFTVVFSSNEKKERFANTYTVLDGAKAKDKISLKTESTSLRIYPAKAGFLTILEYFKKEKKYSVRMEKYKH